MKPAHGLKYLIVVFLIAMFSSVEIHSKDEKEKFVVVIDPGHGGKDIGATDNGVKEKDINLKVAKRLESLIKKKMKDTKVVMTRNEDKYLTLQERADIANKSQGNLFISIHTNSVDKKNRNRKNIEGSSVYTLGLHKDENNLKVAMRENSVIELENDYEQKYSGFDPQKDESYIIFEMAQKKNLSQSIRFADTVEKELVGSGRKDRGVHQAGFWVLWATSMPAVLVELDFICNPQSAKYMASDKGADELAMALFKALEKYEASWNHRSWIDNGIEVDNPDKVPDNEAVIVASAKKKRVKNSGNTLRNYNSNVPLPPGQRKRRSQAAREAASILSYETENLQDHLPSAEPFRVDQQQTLLAETKGSEIGKDNNVATNKKSNNKENKKDKGKKEKNKKEVKTKKPKSNAKINKLVTVYKIQILASEDLLNQENSRFCGLSPISAYKENNLYKYYYGESTDKDEIEKMLPDVRKKIPDAFIVSSTKSVQNTAN